MDTLAQAFFMNMDTEANICEIGAAVILPDDMLAVAGFVGVMPLPVADVLLKAAVAAGVKVTIIINDPPVKIVALTWGKLDPIALWPYLAIGMAESATKAVLNVITEGDQDIDMTGLTDLFRGQ